MYLPKPPSHEQKLLFLSSGKKEIYLFSSISTIVLVFGMLLFVKSNPWFLPYTFFCIVTLSYLALTYFVGFFGKEFDYANHLKILNKWFDRSAREEVDVYLPICGEDLRIIKNTWTWVKKLSIAHEGCLNIYVLDDGKSNEAKIMADEFGFNYVTRPNNNLKKAGNLRHIFSRTSAPYFLILDADFVPREDILLNLLPHMYEDEKVCMVQSTQFFEITDEQTDVQKGAGSIQELFYRLVQVNRDTFDGAICVGSNCLYRRSHLVPYGGTADIGYSEDVRSAYRISKDGLKVRYLPLNLAAGTCPEKWSQLFTQYYRWSMGSLSLLLSKEFWEKGLSLNQRICYLSGMFYYLSTGLYAIFYFVPSMYLLIFKPEMIHWYNLLFSVPSLLFGVFYMKYWMKLKYDMNSIRVRHVSYYAHFFALKDLLFDTLESWQPTGAKTSSKRYETFCIVYTTISIMVPFVTIGLILMRITEGYAPTNFILLTLFTAFNAYVALKVIDDL